MARRRSGRGRGKPAGGNGNHADDANHISDDDDPLFVGYVDAPPNMMDIDAQALDGTNCAPVVAPVHLEVVQPVNQPAIAPVHQMPQQPAIARFQMPQQPAIARFQMPQQPAIARFQMPQQPAIARFQMPQQPAIGPVHQPASAPVHVQAVMPQQHAQPFGAQDNRPDVEFICCVRAPVADAAADGTGAAMAVQGLRPAGGGPLSLRCPECFKIMTHNCRSMRGAAPVNGNGNGRGRGGNGRGKTLRSGKSYGLQPANHNHGGYSGGGRAM